MGKEYNDPEVNRGVHVSGKFSTKPKVFYDHHSQLLSATLNVITIIIWYFVLYVPQLMK